MFLQCSSSPEDAVAGSQSVNVIATAEQVAEQHCQNYPDNFSVFVKLRLQLRNNSHERIIMARQVAPPVHLRISTSPDNLNAGRFIYNPSVSEVSSNAAKAEAFSDAPDPARFVVLDPGAQFEADTWAVVLADLSKPFREGLTNGLSSGRYVMQIFVRTWPYSTLDESEVARIAQEWQSHGNLVTATVPSSSFTITLPRTKHAVACSLFRAPI